MPELTDIFLLLAKIVDGAYGAMMTRLAASDNPNLICMAYDLNRRSVTDLFVVPKQVFTSDLIEARPPLGPQARRAGWVGCNIRLDRAPASRQLQVRRDEGYVEFVGRAGYRLVAPS